MRYHYEHIPGRDRGHEWRVADEHDDVICDFSTEKAASAFVFQHNMTWYLETKKRGWKFR